MGGILSKLYRAERNGELISRFPIERKVYISISGAMNRMVRIFF